MANPTPMTPMEVVSSDTETTTPVVKTEPTEPPTTTKTGKKRRAATKLKGADKPKGTKKSKKKETPSSSVVPVTHTSQEEYDEQWYEAEDEEWYDADDKQWWQYTEEPANFTNAAEENYPWPLWNLIYDDMKVQEDPNVIHDACLLLQSHHIVQPWQLKQAPRTVLEMVFPAATHARHLIIIFQVQELLRQRTDA